MHSEIVHLPAPSVPTTSDDPPWLDRTLYPFARKRFATDLGTLSYVDEGAGSPVLFVHGTPSWSFEWRHAIPAVSRHHRAIALDHLGFGLSDKPASGSYKPEDHARRLLELVRQLDLRDVTLVVHDFGGPIGLPVALREPERVRSVVLVNTWMWPHGADRRVRWLSRFVASPLGRFLYLTLNASPRFLLPASFANRGRLGRAEHRHYFAPLARGQRHAPWVLGKELAGSDAYYAALHSEIGRLRTVPVTILWGERDPAFSLSYLERWREELPHAKVVLLPDAGHFPQEEVPDDFVRKLVAALGGPLGSG